MVKAGEFLCSKPKLGTLLLPKVGQLVLSWIEHILTQAPSEGWNLSQLDNHSIFENPDGQAVPATPFRP